MITDADIKKMKEVFTTKDDLKDFSKRFDVVDKRFDAVDKRFDAVDKRFDAVDKRFDGANNRFDELFELITLDINSNQQRFQRLESEVFKSN